MVLRKNNGMRRTLRVSWPVWIIVLYNAWNLANNFLGQYQNIEFIRSNMNWIGQHLISPVEHILASSAVNVILIVAGIAWILWGAPWWEKRTRRGPAAQAVSPPAPKPSMELTFRDEVPYTTREHPVTKPAYAHSIVLCRIGVRNLTDMTINNVKIFLVDMEDRDPRSESFRAGELRYTSDTPPGFSDSRNGISLIAGAPRVLVDVMRMEEAAIPGRGGIEICYADPSIPRDVDARHYILTIRAEGSSGTPCVRRFIVNVDPVAVPGVRDRTLRFRLEDEE